MILRGPHVAREVATVLVYTGAVAYRAPVLAFLLPFFLVFALGLDRSLWTLVSVYGNL